MNHDVEQNAGISADEKRVLLTKLLQERSNAARLESVCVHRLFEAQVARTPDALAVSSGSQSLSYAQLNERSDRLALHLRSLGIGPEIRVALCLERSVEMVIGLLGILKAGGAYVPLDPAYPLARLSLMLDDARVPVLLTEERLRGLLPPGEAQVVCIDGNWDELNGEAGANSKSPGSLSPTAESLAYVIYTSGSTGRPKGVQVTHRALANFLLSMRSSCE